MSRARRCGADAVTAVVAGLFALLAWASIAHADPPGRLYLGLVWVPIALPWVFAARILWNAWWRSSGERLATLDAPARLLAAAVATLPGERRDWGEAMTAELARVTDPRARWAFAAGCARAAAFPPPGRAAPVAAVALLAAGSAAGAALLVAHTVPGLHTFTLTFAPIVAAMATLAAARSRRPLRRPAPAAAVVGIVGVVAGVAVTARFLARQPDAAEVLDGLGVLLAVTLAACLWLTTAPPRGLTTSRLARALGLLTAAALVAGLVAAIRLPADSGGVMSLLVTVPVPVLFLLAALTAALTRSLRAGVQTVVWTLVPAMLLAFAVWVVEGERWYQRAGGLLMLDNDPGTVGATLGDAVTFVLLVVPGWVFPFGVLGAALGARRRRVGVTVLAQPG